MRRFDLTGNVVSLADRSYREPRQPVSAPRPRFSVHRVGRQSLDSTEKSPDNRSPSMNNTLLTAISFLAFLRLVPCERDNPFNLRNANITDLLDSLLRGYDKHLRPGFGGPPLEVLTNILIRSMGPISEEKMMFSMDCYFRQEWMDKRLTFTPLGDIDVLRPSIKMLHEIWTPDTFFLNGRGSYLHTITYSNKLFRISKDGHILYSQRLTIKSACPMFLHKYPMDSQTCPLMIGSYGYTQRDVRIKWKDIESPVKIYKDILMAQFTLMGITVGNRSTGLNHGGRTVLHVEFKLQREIGYYLLQFYLPCYLIVVISWVSFWINRDATPARVTLGITTLLTTCTIGITGREGIPKVSYSTALDIFLLMCFSFVFAALVEYAGVNYFTKSGQKECPDESEEENDPNKPLIQNTTFAGPAQASHPQTLTTDINGHTMVSGAEPRRKDSCWIMFLHCLRGNTKYKHFKSLHQSGTLSVSKIDSMARIFFPFSFICLNILYWAGFLYYF